MKTVTFEQVNRGWDFYVDTKFAGYISKSGYDINIAHPKLVGNEELHRIRAKAQQIRSIYGTL